MKTSLKILGIFGLGYLLTEVAPSRVIAQPGVTKPIQCQSSAVISGAAAATAELVPVSTAGRRIYVCAVTLTGGGATTVVLKSGTGTTCGTGTVNLTGPLELGDNTVVSAGTGMGYIFRTTAGHALCWTNSATIQVSGFVSYAQF